MLKSAFLLGRYPNVEARLFTGFDVEEVGRVSIQQAGIVVRGRSIALRELDLCTLIDPRR
ncbi:hypothetical protein Pstu01_44280 [Stutzerimonas stutzeri]|nr:hypothetical protein Pstu01_44280 [Stutzerimonas stutzeri]